MLHNRTTQLVALLFGLPFFVFLPLALAQAGSGSSCHWAFPKWFGCVLAAHESLAGGLIGLAGVLVAAWMAWHAVQQQINSDRERALADRAEAERLLSEELPEYAEGMAAAWRLLVALPEDDAGRAVDLHAVRGGRSARAGVEELPGVPGCRASAASDLPRQRREHR